MSLTTFLLGLALATLVCRTGALWASIGVHVGFNVIGLTLIGTEGVLSGAQLFLFQSDDMPAAAARRPAQRRGAARLRAQPLVPFGPRRDPTGI